MTGGGRRCGRVGSEPRCTHDRPIEMVLAVDIDGDGRAAPGEPVIRQGFEPFEDCGLDQRCNVDEPGYDPELNPDPAGDDYDFQYNPRGTEGNWLRDFIGPMEGECSPAAGLGEGEVFSDVGLDGVAETPQLQDGGYDSGEGDGCWTMARGMQRMLETNPRTFVMNADIEVLRNLDYFGDGGIRDLFGFGSNQDQLAGALAARGLPVSLFNGHSALAHDGRLEDQALAELDIHWRDVGKYVQLRYGHIDASEEQLIAGDGGHVGTTTQIINRLLSVMSWMSARWPEGDRAAVRDRICVRLGNGCDHINQIGLEFTSSLGRTGPVSIVLPPGYFDEENADATYPVIYLLHGYGMTPEDLLPSGLIIWTLMTSTMIPEPERLQKMIFVFPDGRCRDDECVRGTFYANAPSSHPQGPQMETFLLDLMDYMDANYRTRAPQTHTIAE